MNGPELEYCQNDHVGAPASRVPWSRTGSSGRGTSDVYV